MTKTNLPTTSEYGKPASVFEMIGRTFGILLLSVGGVQYFLYTWIPDVTEKSQNTTLQAACLIAGIICAAMWMGWIHNSYNYNRYGKK